MNRTCYPYIYIYIYIYMHIYIYILSLLCFSFQSSFLWEDGVVLRRTEFCGTALSRDLPSSVILFGFYFGGHSRVRFRSRRLWYGCCSQWIQSWYGGHFQVSILLITLPFLVFGMCPRYIRQFCTVFSFNHFCCPFHLRSLTFLNWTFLFFFIPFSLGILPSADAMLSLLGHRPLYGAKGQSPLFGCFLNIPGLIHYIIANCNQHNQIPKVNFFAGLLYLFLRIFLFPRQHISSKIFVFTAFAWFVIFSFYNLFLHHFPGRLFG